MGGVNPQVFYNPTNSCLEGYESFQCGVLLAWVGSSQPCDRLGLRYLIDILVFPRKWKLKITDGYCSNFLLWDPLRLAGQFKN